MNYKVNEIRKDFPTLNQRVNGKPLVYLDNAATTHKPNIVIDAMRNYYQIANGNPHRGVHYLGVKSTTLYEQARDKVKEFLNATTSSEIIFTKNTTESLNLIAYAYGMNFVEEGDEIVLCICEHHSNIVPWQMVAKTKRANLKYLYLNRDYRLDESEVFTKITEKTKVVCIAQMSNVLGTVFPLEKIIDYSHKKGAITVIDGAQSAAHMKVDLQRLDADFFVLSAHKLLGPMGVGVAFGKEKLLSSMPPFLFGGDMIEYVEEQQTTFAELPYKFEAGTPNVEGAVGLAAAIDYLENIGFDQITRYETELTQYALDHLSSLPYVKIYGSKNLENRGPVISFSVEGCHPHDVASIVDMDGVAIRAGHHCAQPLMKYLHAPATSRASFSLYNTKEEIDVLIQSLKSVRKWFNYGA